MEVAGGVLALGSGMEGGNGGEGMDGGGTGRVDRIWRASVWECFGGMLDALALARKLVLSVQSPASLLPACG